MKIKVNLNQNNKINMPDIFGNWNIEDLIN